MRLYSVVFGPTAVTAAVDLFEINAASTCGVVIHGWEIFQSTDYGDAAAEGLTLALIRDHSTSGSGGSAPTPAPLRSNVGAAASTAEVLNTTVATGGSPITLFRSGWNIQAGAEKWFTPETRPRIGPSGRIVLTQSAPADSITMSGTLYFEEV